MFYFSGQILFNMKALNSLTILLLATFFSNLAFATDRVVQQGGPVGTYASISAAITAAVDGDVIIINNRTDGLPWYENLAINKSLTFVSAVDNIQWWIEGTITITMAESREITIIGLRNTLANGHLNKTGSVPTNRTVVNVLHCDIAGDLGFSGGGINLYLGSTKAREVQFSYGKVIGNDLRSILLSNDAATTEDVNLIIGNRVGLHTSPSNNAINLNNNTQYLYCSNNYARSSANSTVYIAQLKPGATTNRIINCTFTSLFSSGNPVSGYAALAMVYTTGTLLIENSAFGGYYSSSTNGANAIYASGASPTNTTFNFNLYYHTYSSGYVPPAALNNFNSTTPANSNVSTTDGSFLSGSDYSNAGNPLNDHLDLNLSRNDIGVFGGSYSMANFLPLLNNPESSRVNYMTTPRIVYQGQTVTVQAIGYDK